MTRTAARLKSKARRARRAEYAGDMLCLIGIAVPFMHVLGQAALGWSQFALMLPFILLALLGMLISVLGMTLADQYDGELEALTAASLLCPAWHNAGMGYDSDGEWWRIGCTLGAGHAGHLHQDASGEVFVQVLDTAKQEAKER